MSQAGSFNTDSVMFPDQSNIVYVGKHGDDANSGLSIQEAKLTFGAAITAAFAIAPAVVVCLDEGTYTENLTGQVGVDIYAPNATISGAHTMVAGNNWHFDIAAVADGVTGFTFDAVGSLCVLSVNEIICLGAGIASAITAADYIYIKCTNAIIDDGYFLGVAAASAVTLQLGEINIGGAGAFIAPAAAADIDVIVNSVHDTGGLATLISSVGAAGTQIHIVAAHIDIEELSNIDATTVVNIDVTSLEGTLAEVGVGSVASIGGATVIEGVPIGAGTASTGDFTTITTTNPIGATYGGTGVSDPTDHSLIVGSGAGAMTELGVAANGELPIGSVGADPVLATITAGAGINVANAAGSITITNTAIGGVNQSNIVYVGKHGNDANSGLFIEEAKLTFGAAITVAAGIVPAVVVCLDNGTYTENLTGVTEVDIYAPNAKIVGVHTVAEDEGWEFLTATAATGTTGFTYNSAAATTSYLTLKQLVCEGTGIGIAATNTCTVDIHIGIALIQTGAFLSLSAASLVHIYVDAFQCATGTFITTSAAGNIYVLSKNLKNTGAGTLLTSTGGAAGTKVTIMATRVAFETLSNIDATVVAVLDVAKLEGTLAEAGAGAFARIGGATKIEGVPIGASIASTGDFTTITTTNPIDVAYGGTGVASPTDHVVLVGSGAAAMTELAVGATNEVLLGNTAADPSWGAVPNAALSNSSVTLNNGNNITVTGGTPLALGGTASFDLTGTTDHAVQVGDATGSLDSLAVGATGETLMGSTGADPGWTGSPSFSGTATAATGLTATSGNITASAGNLALPTTIAALTAGVITINGTRVFHSYGTDNLFVGLNAGNGTTTGSGKNVGIGGTALGALTTGNYNCALGYGSLTACQDGVQNTGMGPGTLHDCTSGRNNIGVGINAAYYLTTGGWNTCIGGGTLSNAGITSASYNTCISHNAGISLTTTDSNNICISNSGTATDNNTIRIGTQGTGDGQQDTTYIAGIYGTAVGATYKIATVDNAHKLGGTAIVPADHGGTGVASITDHSLVVGSGTAAMTELGVATHGQLPIGSTGADPVLATITAGVGVNITNAAGSITINAGGVNQTKIVYVGGHGNDGNDGLTINKAKLTFGAAITVATGMAPAVVVCLDNIGYTENLTGVATVDIYAPNASITGAHTVQHDEKWEFGLAVAATGTTGFTFSSATGTPSQLKLKQLNCEGTGIGVAITNTNTTDINIGDIWVGSGSFLSVGAVVARVNIHASNVKIDDTGTFITATGAATINAIVEDLWNEGADVGVLLSGTSAQVSITATHLDIETLSNIDGTVTAVLDVAYLSGTNTEAGVGAFARIGGATKIEGVPIGAGTASTGDFTTITTTNPIGATYGGTGVSDPTDHSLIVGSGAGAMTELGVATHGQIPIGSTGADPVLATITQGANITVTNAAGSITIAAAGGGGISWSIITADLDPMVIDNGYICNKGGLLSMTLPATSVVGSVLRVTGMNTNVGWRIVQRANQQIHFSGLSTTAGAGGYLESTLKRDSVELVCVVADLDFNVISSVGNLTIV